MSLHVLLYTTVAFYSWLLFFANGRCAKSGCGALIRPHVVWFGESLFREVLERVDEELSKCDLCLLVSEKVGCDGQ